MEHLTFDPERLAAQEHPLTHPWSYQHGYQPGGAKPVMDGYLPWHHTVGCPVPADTLVDVINKDRSVAHGVPAGRVIWGHVNYYRYTARQHPGPITLHEPRTDWLAWVMVAAGLALCGLAAYGHMGGFPWAK